MNITYLLSLALFWTPFVLVVFVFSRFFSTKEKPSPWFSFREHFLPWIETEYHFTHLLEFCAFLILVAVLVLRYGSPTEEQQTLLATSLKITVTLFVTMCLICSINWDFSSKKVA